MADREIKLKDPRNVKRRLYFTCVDATALQTRLQASDMSTFTCKLSKNGGSGASSTNSPVEVDSTNKKGEFYLELTAAECDTAGVVTIKISNAGGTKAMEPRELDAEILTAYLFTAQSGSTGTSIITDRTEATTGHFASGNRVCLVEMLTGSLAGQVDKATGYNGTSKTLALNTGFTGAPANGDIGEIHVR